MTIKQQFFFGDQNRMKAIHLDVVIKGNSFQALPELVSTEVRLIRNLSEIDQALQTFLVAALLLSPIAASSRTAAAGILLFLYSAMQVLASSQPIAVVQQLSLSLGHCIQQAMRQIEPLHFRKAQ